MELTPAALLQADHDLIWHPFTPLQGAMPPLLVEKGEGAWLITADGKRILDAVSSWWVNLHGHAHPHIAGAIAAQAMQMEHVIFAGFTHRPAILLATRLMELLPASMGKIFYSDNGSTAVEVALKLAVQYWHQQGTPRSRVVALEGAYHGDTFGAMSAGQRSVFTAAFNELLFAVDFVPLPTPQNREHVVRQFTVLMQSGQAAAFIFEPLVQGAAGMRMYSPMLLDELMGIARAHGVLCIADEVMTGFGRTGTLFATDQTSHKPDLICLSKGLTGGFLPLGVTAVADFIVNAFQTSDPARAFYHGHSYTANPLACSAALASLDLLLTDACQSSRTMIAQSHNSRFEVLAAHPKVKNARTTGTILAIELDAGNTSYFNAIRERITPYFLERGILLRPLGNIIYVLPPYVITLQELHLVYEAIEAFLSE